MGRTFEAIANDAKARATQRLLDEGYPVFLERDDPRIVNEGMYSIQYKELFA